MTPASLPATPNQWSEFLATQELPAPSATGENILKLLQDENLPYTQLAQEINQDPVISFKVMSAANPVRSEEVPGSKTLDHAISMIGLDNLKALTLSLSTNLPSAPPPTAEYMNALCTSLLASSLARTIALQRKPSQADDIYWAALFHGVPHWYLGQFASPQIAQLRNAVIQEFTPPMQAQKAILGCALLDVKKLLTQRLNVPQLVRECWNTSLQPTRREWVTLSKMVNQPLGQIQDNHLLSIKLNHPVFSILLANQLARYAMQDWYSRGTLRMQKVLATYLGIGLSQAIQLCHECAADVSRSHPLPDTLLPATRLFLPPFQRQKTSRTRAAETLQPEIAKPDSKQNKTATLTSEVNLSKSTEQIALSPPAGISVKPVTEAASSRAPQAPIIDAPPVPVSTVTAQEKKPEIPPPPSAVPRKETPAFVMPVAGDRGNPAIFQELTSIMLHHAEEFADIHELMNAATQGISYGLGISRTLVMLVNTRQTRLKTYYHVGTRKRPELESLEIDLTRPSLFNKLIEKAASIWVKPDSSERIWSMVPATLKMAGGAREFFLMSIYVNKKPIAVFYADHEGGKGGGLSEEDYKQFKYLCATTAQCLTTMAVNKEKQRDDDLIDDL